MAEEEQERGHLSPSYGPTRRTSERIVIQSKNLYSFRTSDAELEVKYCL